MNPLFTIEPWELPPDCDAPLVAPADFVLTGLWEPTAPDCWTEIWVRAIPYRADTYLLYSCNGERPEDGNWSLPWEIVERDGIIKPSMEAMYELLEIQRAEMWMGAKQRVYFNGSDYGFPGWFYIATSLYEGCHLCSHLDKVDEQDNDEEYEDAEERQAAIGVSPRSSTHPTSSRQIKESLFTALDNENSELRFALQWWHLTPHQQQETALCFERGNLSEMQILMRAVLYSQEDLWRAETTLNWATRDWSKNEYFEVPQLNVVTKEFPLPPIHPSIYRYNSVKFSSPHTASILQRWRHVLWDYFNPSFNEEVFNFAQCVREASEVLATIVVTASSPTAHERMEALYVLREWWQKKYSPLLFGNRNADT